MDVVDSTIIPSLVFLGTSGCGRRRLATALVQARTMHVDLADHDPGPEPQGAPRPSGDERVDVVLLDTPGPGGEDPLAHEQARPALARILSSAHVAAYVVDWPSPVAREDVAFLGEVRAMAPALPLIVLCSGVDRSARDFVGEDFDPEADDQAARSVARWARGVGEALAGLAPAGAFLCAAGSSSRPQSRYNLEAVSDAIMGLLPVAARLEWQCCSVVNASRGERAEKMVLAATAVAGGIGVAPLPVADMPFIVTTQVTLLAGLFRLYGRSFNQDALRSLVLAGLSAVVGPLAFGALTKVVPGLGSIVGGGVAAACTYAVGEVARSILEDGGSFEADDFKTAVRKVYEEKRKGMPF